jgi:hypothetical protein
MFSCLLEQEKEKRRRQPKGKERSAQNQPNNLSPSYISDLKSFWIALYASAATVLSLELLSRAYDTVCKAMTSPCRPFYHHFLLDLQRPCLIRGRCAAARGARDDSESKNNSCLALLAYFHPVFLSSPSLFCLF